MDENGRPDGRKLLLAPEKRFDIGRILSLPPTTGHADRPGQLGRTTNEGKQHIPPKITLMPPNLSQAHSQRPVAPSLQRQAKAAQFRPQQSSASTSTPKALPFFERYKSTIPTLSPMIPVKQISRNAEEEAAAMKLEQFSDGPLPPSSPPLDDNMESVENLTHATERPVPMLQSSIDVQTVRLDHLRAPRSNASRPRDREISQAASTSNTARSDDPETDFQEITVKALKDVHLLKSQLREQRKQTQDAVARFETLTAAHIPLKSQHTNIQQELEEYRRRLEASEEARLAAQEELSKTRDDLLSHQEQLKAAKDEAEATKAHLADLTTRFEATEANLEEVRDSTHAKLIGANERLETMGNSLRSMKEAFDGLKSAQEHTQANRRQLRDFREEVATRLQKLGGILNDQGKLIHGVETKGLVTELKDELENSHRVNDILRDKLHSLSSELANTQAKVLELENDQRMALLRFIEEMKQAEDKTDLQKQVCKLVSEITAERNGSMESAVVAARLEEQLNNANTKMIDLECTLERQKAEHGKEIQDYIHQQKLLAESKDSMEVSQKQISADYRNSQEICRSLQQKNEELSNQLRSRIEDYVALDTKRERLESCRDELTKELADRAVSQEKLKARIKETEEKLVLREEEGKDFKAKLEAMSTRVSEAESEQTNLRHTLELEREKSRQADLRTAEIQNKLDTQTLTLRLTKEQFGDCQERLSTVQRSSNQTFKEKDMEIARLNTVISDSLKKAIEESSSRLTAIQVRFEQKLENATDKQVGLFDAVETKWKKTQGESDELKKSLQKRVECAEREAVGAWGMIQDLKAQIQAMTETHASVLEATESKNAASLSDLQATADRLQAVNEELRQHSATLVERYKACDLSDVEKDFVDWLLRQSASLHEQDALAKENELRRRDNLINTLQTRVKELEAHLARTLRERNSEEHTANETLVDLKAWTKSSSSPPKPDIVQAGPAIIPEPQQEPPTPDADPSDSSSPAPRRISRSLRALDFNAADSISSFGVSSQPECPSAAKKGSIAPTAPNAGLQLHLEKSKAPSKTLASLDLSDVESDLEDDIPLSEVSHIGLLGKRDRSPEPVKAAAKKRVVETKKVVNKGTSSRPIFDDDGPYSKAPMATTSTAANRKTVATSASSGAATKGRKKRK